MTTRDHRAVLLLPVAFFFAVAGVIFWQTRTDLVEKDAASGGPQYDAAFVPELLATALILFGLWQIVRIWRGLETFSDGTAALPLEDADDTVAAPTERALELRAAAAFLAMILFTAVLPVTGYYVAMPVYLAVTLIILGVRNPLSVIAWSAALTLGAGYAFGSLLNVRLPVGIWEIAIW